jgi:hypothetical protein
MSHSSHHAHEASDFGVPLELQQQLDAIVALCYKDCAHESDPLMAVNAVTRQLHNLIQVVFGQEGGGAQATAQAIRSIATAVKALIEALFERGTTGANFVSIQDYHYGDRWRRGNSRPLRVSGLHLAARCCLQTCRPALGR